MLLDILLWLLVLAGVESVQVPKDLRTMADLTFDFPYSHGLVASLGWSLVMFTIGWFVGRRFPQQRFACALALAADVFSHFILDWLVHIPELPLAGRDSMLLGFGLWKNLPLLKQLRRRPATRGHRPPSLPCRNVVGSDKFLSHNFADELLAVKARSG